MTSQELVKVFASQINENVNLNHYAHCDFEKSPRMAQEKDQMTLKMKNKLPPLHGLPISIKDQIPTMGFYDTAGYVV